MEATWVGILDNKNLQKNGNWLSLVEATAYAKALWEVCLSLTGRKQELGFREWQRGGS